MSEKKVSIIMATYNREDFIVETLLAIQKQSYQFWECLIIDDGGNDNTAKVIAPILAVDERFSFLKRPSSYGKGLPGSRNFGLDAASGDFIIFFDDDDIPHPQNLEICINEFRDATLDFCRYKRAVFQDDFHYKFDTTESFGKFEFTKNDLLKMIDHTIPFNSCQVMWSKKCFEGMRFNESLMYAEEWELYSRILCQNVKGVSIKKTLFYGRKHLQSNTGEFYSDSPIRKKSKMEACKMIVTNLNNQQLLSPQIQKYFTWKAVTLKAPSILKHIISQSSLSFFQKLKAIVLYRFSPLIKIYLKNKKKLKRNSLN
ncbi:MAG: GalNAc5-diNAcBac-PP-undecaprenol beta-1,3-glucosyltransferase [Sediminicola sp.]|mgnify:CR=1 FL=1|jgi:glycosyltransferase involved in cell wall biosynthesis|tara:strand:- start:1308 stop:2249 length:942 start_codon:yes stop_codon:yes gene_type:complete